MDEKIQWFDLRKQYEQIKDEIQQAIKDVCENTAFSDGPFVERFENNFATYCNTEYALAVNSGTAALHLALIAAGIKEGDEVIVPANTFIATPYSISYVNAKPVFVDCTSDTWNISPVEIEKKITKKTTAIIGVHLYGQPFDIDSVNNISKKSGLKLIEDCAQAHGAKYKGQEIGLFGEFGCFSFYPGKNLGAYGEGGAIIFNKPEYKNKLKSLRSHGSLQKYHHAELGFNMRMDGIQGAILDVKLKHLPMWNKRRQEIASMYQNGIKNSSIKLQHQPEWSESVYHLFVIMTQNRDRLKSFLESLGIYCGIHYPIPCHLQDVYSNLDYCVGSCINAEKLANSCLTLPLYPELTDIEVERVIDALNKYK